LKQSVVYNDKPQISQQEANLPQIS
jgi:hypothetical protein